MIKRKQFIEISNPCREKWSDMEIVSLGRHCMVCEKKVVDFTRMSDQQVIDILHQSNFKTCGRFTENQLLNGFEKRKENYLPFKLKAAASAILLLLSDKALALNTPKINKVEINPEFNSKEVYTFKKLHTIQLEDSTHKYMKGVVIDDITGEVIPGVKLFIKGSSQKTISDMDGRFILDLPDLETVDSVILIVSASFLEIKDFEFFFSKKEDFGNISIFLPSSINDIQTIGELAPVKKKWWKRKKRK